MEPIHTGRPRGRGEPGQHTLVFDETADTRRRLHPRARLDARLRRQKAALAAESQHLRAVHRRQTAFMAQVAHELGTPLTGIILSLQLVLEGNGSPSAGRPREWLDLSRRHAARLAALAEVAAVSKVPWQEIAAVGDVFRQEGQNFLTPPLGKKLEPDSRVDINHESLIRQWRRLPD